MICRYWVVRYWVVLYWDCGMARPPRLSERKEIMRDGASYNTRHAAPSRDPRERLEHRPMVSQSMRLGELACLRSLSRRMGTSLSRKRSSRSASHGQGNWLILTR